MMTEDEANAYDANDIASLVSRLDCARAAVTVLVCALERVCQQADRKCEHGDTYPLWYEHARAAIQFAKAVD